MATDRATIVPGAIAKTIAELRTFIDDLSLSDEVLRILTPNGQPHDFECEIWDYKEHLPTRDLNMSEEQRKAAIGEIIKDAVAFHNAYGGYILFGVSDRGKGRIRGCEGTLDVGDLNKRVQHYTGTAVQCLYRNFDLDGVRNLGLLLIPRRHEDAVPVAFIKRGPEKGRGERCFNEGTYVRIGDECRPASATSADWKFLHSDRSPPQQRSSYNLLRTIRCSVPARDLELVEFVGREGTLNSLRAWLADNRSPVRLISGIGGLGKTTVAYRFLEELLDAKPISIEWVIWLTAKRQTFSALRGRLVPTTGADFSDLKGLLRRILATLSHDFAEEDDEPEVGEVIERAAEALQTYSCLVVVDDIDSLSPEEQRETVASLNGIALRSVGRDIPPSRFLMTSRVDQGLPPTAVIKIAGLEKDALRKHVANLCTIFGVPPIQENMMDELYQVTSGSPLFAASIVRLVKLGETVSSALTTWRGQDGEDVRRFAFEREIVRLNAAQTRLLYAVLLLRETSVSDLAAILDTSSKAVRDRISELQAYHLLATGTQESGDTTIFAPAELVAVTEILRNHMGPTSAEAVEKACARAEELSRVDDRSIGVGIRSIVNLWNSKRFEEALIASEELRRKHPKNADVASLLGAALLRASPPQFSQADGVLCKAYEMGCSRPELFPNIIKTKSALEDWAGLHDLTLLLTSSDIYRDEPLDAYLLAVERLLAIARDRGDWNRASELAIEAVEKIARKTRFRLSDQLFQQINAKRLDFGRQYIAALDVMAPRASDKLKVFEGVIRLCDSDVVLGDLVKHGVNALQVWWRDVEQRPVLNTAVCSILARQLRRMEKLEARISTFERVNEALVKSLQQTRHDLEYRGAQLVS